MASARNYCSTATVHDSIVILCNSCLLLKSKSGFKDIPRPVSDWPHTVPQLTSYELPLLLNFSFTASFNLVPSIRTQEVLLGALGLIKHLSPPKIFTVFAATLSDSKILSNIVPKPGTRLSGNEVRVSRPHFLHFTSLPRKHFESWNDIESFYDDELEGLDTFFCTTAFTALSRSECLKIYIDKSTAIIRWSHPSVATCSRSHCLCCTYQTGIQHPLQSSPPFKLFFRVRLCEPPLFIRAPFDSQKGVLGWNTMQMVSQC